MKSNRPFYFGLGCLVATLFWAIAAGVVSDNGSTVLNPDDAQPTQHRPRQSP